MVGRLYKLAVSASEFVQGSYIVFTCQKDAKTVQGALVRMARPFDQENGVVKGIRH